ARFCVDVASGRRVDLDFCERAVFAEGRKRVVEVGVERLLRRGSEVVNHEIGSVKGVAAGAITLRSAGEIETGFGEELVLEIEAGLIDIAGGFAENCAENLGTSAGVQILTDFECG